LTAAANSALNAARSGLTLISERGVLIGTDGPYNNVLKIRPPMPFAAGDAAILLEALEASIGELSGGG